MKSSRRWFILIGTLVFLTGVVVSIPARVAVGLFAPEEARISGIDGTVWRGEAKAIDVLGIYLRDVKWRIKPLRLFLGQVSMDLEATPVGGFVNTSLTVSPGQNLTLEDLTASIPLDLLAESVRVPGLGGQANLRFDSLLIRQGVPSKALGDVDIVNLIVPLLHPGSLGAYSLEFAESGDAIVASLEDVDGIVDVAGSLTFKSDRSYQLLAMVDSRRDTPERLQAQINYLPKTGNGNQREVRLEGIL